MPVALWRPITVENTEHICRATRFRHLQALRMEDESIGLLSTNPAMVADQLLQRYRCPSRDSASHIQLLEQIVQDFPSQQSLIIEDNLIIHKGRHTRLALAAWPEIRVQFLLKHACWLNLIEPWWKQLRSLALKGRRFETTDELVESLNLALDYWNLHRHPYVWKKQPQRQSQLLGAFGIAAPLFP